MKRFYKMEGISSESVDTLAMYLIIGSLLGARLGHCLFYEPEYYLHHPLEIFQLWSGELGKNAKIGLQGLASHGGTLGIMISIFIFSRVYKTSYIWLLDRISVLVPVGACLIRLGNLMNHEIVGKPTDVPWAFIFARLRDNTPRHPAQLYEAIAYLIIFGIMLWIYLRNYKTLKNGFLLGWFFIMVFGVRFFIEFVKINQVDFEYGMIMNMGQLLSIPFVLLGIGLIIWSRYYKPNALVKKNLQNPPKKNKNI
jgi:prolipoprotein diacylglyceryl transferase